MPASVFVVIVENEKGERGIWKVCATESLASSSSYAASHEHVKAWYEPHEVEGETHG
jgi:hypothetical protein